MFLVDARAHKIDDGDVMSGLAPCSNSVTEHEAERSLEHGLVGLLQTCFLIKGQDLARRSEFFSGACEEAVDLGPVGYVSFQLFHPAQSGERVYCARYLQERHLFDSGVT